MYSNYLKNKNVVITGCNRGIGKATLEEFSKNGANTFACVRNTSAEFKKYVNDLKKKYKVEIKVIKIDLLDNSSISSCVNEIYKTSKNIDILINNAGITGSTAALWDYDVDEWNKIVEINLMGTFNCCKSIVPSMIKNNYGRIVNVASVSGKDGNANASAYSSAKAGVLGLTKSLGKELAEKNIAVNAVTPAGAKTRILDQMSKEHVEKMLSKVPRGRFLELNELTSLVCWLSSEENSFSTAAVFDISGGRSTY